MNSSSKDDFIFPYRSFHGETTLPNVIFDANLQEFSQRVALVCALENGGKITPKEAYQEIKNLWKQLKASKEQILDQEPPPVS